MGSEGMDIKSKSGIKWFPILLVGLPLWLVASTALGLGL